MRIPGPRAEGVEARLPRHGREDARAIPKPAQGGADGDTKWFVQEAAAGFRYAVMASARRDGEGTLLAVTITTSGDGPDPVALGRKRLAAALRTGYAKMLAPHEAWWREFWRKSRVELPELNHLRHYYLVQYFYGAASRLGAPPMPLQGVWTADNGGLPPWKGDYHNDLNTQMTYIAYQTAGRFDQGRCFLEFLWKLLPEFRPFARKFYDAPGAAVPGVMTLDGKPLGGWAMYSLQPTNAAWLGYLFYQHWRYTMDEAFLRDRAYPWCAEIGQCLLHLLKPDANGVLKLPLSSSPEIHDNSLECVAEAQQQLRSRLHGGAVRRPGRDGRRLGQEGGGGEMARGDCRPGPAGGRSADQLPHARPRRKHRPNPTAICRTRFRFTPSAC